MGNKPSDVVDLNFMVFYFYTAVSSFPVSFAQFLIGSSKRVLLWRLFCTFLHIILVYNTRTLMSQIIPTKKNLTNLGLNLGQLVCWVPDWVEITMD